MVLAPNVGSDRSWVYNTTADMGDDGVTAETLAIRFGNSDSQFSYCLLSIIQTCLQLTLISTNIWFSTDANAFKGKFEEAQKINNGLTKEPSATATTDQAESSTKEQGEAGKTETAQKEDKKSEESSASKPEPTVQSDATTDAVADVATETKKPEETGEKVESKDDPKKE